MTRRCLISMRAAAPRLLGIAVAIFFAVSAFGADEAGPVAKPEPKVGDVWAYRRTDFLANKVVFTRNDRVVSTGPDEILVVAKRSDQTGEFDVFFTSEWNPLVIGGTTLIPRADFFKFPLKVGASYAASYETVNKGSNARSKFEFKFTVTGWEDIAVPAGKFRALKVEGNGNYIRLDTGQRFGGMVRVRFWYVPEIKRWAKLTYEEAQRGFGYPDTTYGDELVQFSVQ